MKRFVFEKMMCERIRNKYIFGLGTKLISNRSIESNNVQKLSEHFLVLITFHSFIEIDDIRLFKIQGRSSSAELLYSKSRDQRKQIPCMAHRYEYKYVTCDVILAKWSCAIVFSGYGIATAIFRTHS